MVRGAAVTPEELVATLAALITQFAMTSPAVAEDRQRHGYIR
jgi:hypothetical protein